MDNVLSIYYKRQNFLFYAILIILCLPVLAVRFANLLNYPVTEGFDGTLHLKYILHLAGGRGLPDAKMNLESYQPPLYYISSAGIFRLFIGFGSKITEIALKSFSTVVCLITAVLSIKILSLFIHRKNISFVPAFLLCLYLPMNIYISPMLGNDPLSSCLICCGLLVFLLSVKNNDFSVKKAFLLGVFAGLGLLTKYTAVLLVVSIIISMLYLFIKRKVTYKKTAVYLWIFLSVAIFISGWWYARNYSLYGDFFVKPNDMVKFSKIYTLQPPGQHSLFDFVLFDKNVFLEPVLAKGADFDTFYDNNYSNYNTVFNSVLTGTFSTMWIENHGVFLFPKDSKNFKLAKLILALASIPSVLIVFGIIIMFIDINKNNLFLPLISIGLVSIVFYTAYNLKYPYFCHVKAVFLNHLTPLLAVSYWRSMDYIKRRSKPAFIFLAVEFLVVCFMIVIMYTY